MLHRISYILLSGVLCFSELAAAEEVRQYDWIIAGRVAGHLVLNIGDSGSRRVEFTFNDRGRGPDISEHALFDQNGQLIDLALTGHSYLGASVDERFQVNGQAANWRSKLEQGSSANAEGAFYVANDGTAEQKALLARALLDSEAGSLPLLPTGEATIRRALSLRVGPENDRREASLYAIGGLDLAPTWLWLDQNRELLASIQGGMGLVPAGWSDSFATLSGLQSEAEAGHHEALASTLTLPLGDEFAIRNGGLVDVERGELLPDTVLIVRGGVIAAMGPEVPEGFGGEVIDAGGAYVVPGLWDMHTHIGLAEGIQHIAGGVTTVRDMGGSPARLAQSA